MYSKLNDPSDWTLSFWQRFMLKLHHWTITPLKSNFQSDGNDIFLKRFFSGMKFARTKCSISQIILRKTSVSKTIFKKVCPGSVNEDFDFYKLRSLFRFLSSSYLQIFALFLKFQVCIIDPRICIWQKILFKNCVAFCHSAKHINSFSWLDRKMNNQTGNEELRHALTPTLATMANP